MHQNSLLVVGLAQTARATSCLLLLVTCAGASLVAPVCPRSALRWWALCRMARPRWSRNSRGDHYRCFFWVLVCVSHGLSERQRQRKREKERERMRERKRDIYIYIHTRIYIDRYVWMYMYVCIYLHSHLHIHICVHMIILESKCTRLQRIMHTYLLSVCITRIEYTFSNSLQMHPYAAVSSNSAM